MIKCSISGCDRPHHARGWCSTHWARWKRNGEPGEAENRKPGIQYIERECSIDGCNRIVRMHGLCSMHNQRFKDDEGKWKNPKRLKNMPGEGYLDKYGYVRYYRPDHPNSAKNGSVYGHVIEMSKKLGRQLFPFEKVHHIDGNRSNNNPENLEVWMTGHPYGQRVKDLVESCIPTYLKLYGSKGIIELIESLTI